MARKKSKFLRIGYTQYSKLGLRRKNKQKYRKGKGGENKMRLKMKGHLRNVSIGFRNEKKTRGLVKGLEPVLVYNLEQLKKIQKNEIGIIAKMGNKNKIEIADYALKNNIRLSNLNPKKFLDKIEEAKKVKQEEKSKKEISKKEREKKAKETEKKGEKKEEKTSEKTEVKEEEEKESKETELEKSIKNYESDIKENVEGKKQ